jgi:ACS family sodium-dependent inorganic phosphate cotransporter
MACPTTAAAAAGSLADRYGGKFVLTTGVFLWSLFTVLTPSAAAAGTVPLLAARVLLGVGEGVAFPSIHSMIGEPQDCYSVV